MLFGFTILLRGETLTEITRIQYVETSLAKSEKFLFENGKITFFKDGSLKGRAELTKKQKNSLFKDRQINKYGSLINFSDSQ